MLRLMSLASMLLIVVISAGMLICTTVVGARLPEGWQIDYATRERDGTWYVETMDLDRRLDYRMQTGVQLRDVPLLSPDRRLMVYSGNNGLTLRHLATSIEQYIDDLGVVYAWSPDSTRFAYMHIPTEGEIFETSIVTVDENGIIVNKQLVADESGISQTGLIAWSPDSETSIYRTVTITNTQGVVNALYITDADGQNLRLITPDIVNILDMAWSPDGIQLAFIWRDFAVNRDILERIAIDGSEQTQIAEIQVSLGVEILWSPDGRYIAVVAPPRLSGSAVNIYDAETGDGTGPIDLNLWAQEISWSPDSARLVFRSGRDMDFYRVDRDGRNIRRLTDNDNLNVLLP